MRWKLVMAILFLVAAQAALGGQSEFKMLTLRHRLAQDVLPVVQSMVGEGGTANAVDNTLIIRTTPDRLAAIEETVSRLDVTPRNIRIEISHDSNLSSQNNHASVSGRARIGHGEAIVGNPPVDEGIRLDLDQGSRQRQSYGSQFITVMDGARAFIRVGQSIPYTRQWVLFTQRYTQVAQSTEFHDITTGFTVIPHYIGDEVEVEIMPRIAGINSNGIVDFEALSTRVRVKPGQWFDLGGMMQASDEVSRTILDMQSDTASGSTGLMLRVD